MTLSLPRVHFDNVLTSLAGLSDAVTEVADDRRAAIAPKGLRAAWPLSTLSDDHLAQLASAHRPFIFHPLSALPRSRSCRSARLSLMDAYGLLSTFVSLFSDGHDPRAHGPLQLCGKRAVLTAVHRHPRCALAADESYFSVGPHTGASFCVPVPGVDLNCGSGLRGAPAGNVEVTTEVATPSADGRLRTVTKIVCAKSFKASQTLLFSVVLRRFRHLV